jgi:hypothetical protein
LAFAPCALCSDGYNGAPLLEGPLISHAQITKRPYKTKGWQFLLEVASSQNKAINCSLLIDGANYFGIIRHLG